MSIRKKTMTIIVLTFLVLVASLTVAAKILVMGGFIKLEQQDARTNVQRGMNEIANSLSSLNSIAGDWAPWDDTYNFVQDRNEAYISNNLNAETLVNLRLNFMLFINTDRQIVHGVYVDLNEATESPRPPNLVDLITSTSKLAEHADLESSQAGILMMASQPVMVASRPIIKSDFSGPIRGALVVGRYLDATEIERLGGITHLTLSVQPFDDKKIPDEFKNAKSAFSDDTHTVIRLLDQAFIAGYGLLKDIDGKPALILKAKIPRNIYYHGRTTIIYYVASLFGIGMVFIALATILLEKVVLSRLSRLNHAVSDIGASGDLSRKLTVDSKDELGNLSTEINDMLAQLKDARQKLLGQSYRSGMSDMAAGVLHNVRNSLNPVVGHIELLRDNLKKAPINQIEMAQQELEKGGVSEERKKDLVKFLTLADKTLIKLVNDTRYKLDDTVERIMHIEQILDDHQKWAHTQAPQEEIQLYNLIQDALNFIRHDFGGTVSIQIDPGLSELGTITGHRMHLMQVFENVLLNSAESIQRKGLESGEISIKSALEQKNGRHRVHILIRDNGEGLEPEMQKRIFERGFSGKKKKSSGIGLHWCANVVSSLNGRIYAESEGIGKGTCMHLVLPKHLENNKTEMDALKHEDGDYRSPAHSCS